MLVASVGTGGIGKERDCTIRNCSLEMWISHGISMKFLQYFASVESDFRNLADSMAHPQYEYSISDFTTSLTVKRSLKQTIITRYRNI